ncbi:MAG: hypothetical protein LBH61_05855 [Dysgonamonadaceae bacterium]|jgi:hypothetical protein|nr:hypothetical protein [Dysgonamonadaceae bacterium]
MKKKLFFLTLAFVMTSAASVNAQVLIGEGNMPDPSAILELRSDKLGLLLPQVKLDSQDDTFSLANPKEGMLVCNLNGALKKGVYYWNGNQWTLYIEF